MNKKKEAIDRIVDEFGEVLTVGFVEQAVEDGRLDPHGKTDAELAKEINRLFHSAHGSAATFRFLIDHRPNLLKEARRYMALEQLELACLMYATWCEHWLNRMIAVLCTRKGFSSQQITAIIRAIPFHGKATWLLPLLGTTSLHERHSSAMLRLAEQRNAYAHYKWRGPQLDTAYEEILALKEFLGTFERTVTYLRQYEARRLFGGTKRRLQRVAKEFWDAT